MNAGAEERQANSLGRLVSSSLGLASTGIFPVFLAGALAVQMSSEFGYGPRGIGLSIAGFYAISSLASVALGRLADRVGWRQSIRLGALGCVVSLLSVGALAQSLASVVILIGLAGVGNALLQPAVNLLIARRAPFPKRGLLFGLKQAAIPFATFVGGVSVPALALTVGWRWAFFGAAVFGLLALMLLPDDERPDKSGEREQRNENPLRRPFRSLASFVLVSLFGQTGASVLGSFVVVSAVHVGIREGDAGLLLAVASIAGIVARVLVGWSADKGLQLNLAPISALLILGSIGLGVTAIPTTWAAIVGTVIGFVAGWGWPGLFNLIVVDRFANAPATATSATQTGVYVGNGIGPLLFGLIAAWSFTAAWLTSAAFLVVAAGVAAGAYLSESRVIGA